MNFPRGDRFPALFYYSFVHYTPAITGLRLGWNAIRDLSLLTSSFSLHNDFAKIFSTDRPVAVCAVEVIDIVDIYRAVYRLLYLEHSIYAAAIFLKMLMQNWNSRTISVM